MICIAIYYSYQNECKLKKCNKLICNLYDKTGSGSGTRNALLNLISNQSDFDKMYLYAKDPYEAKYHFLITKKRKHRIKAF